MNLSAKAQDIHSQIDEHTKLGEIRKVAKEIKVDHELAMELWSSGKFLLRQLAILIMDKKQINQEVINQLTSDMESHLYDEKIHLIDWLMANQLTKNKKVVALFKEWENGPSSLLRRVFWYHQARLRWMGNTNHDNTEYLLDAI